MQTSTKAFKSVPKLQSNQWNKVFILRELRKRVNRRRMILFQDIKT